MLGPAARSRALAGAAALLTLAGASAVLGVGSSPTSGATARTAISAPFVGPVVPAPRPQPLVRTDGPLLPGVLAYAPTRLVPVLPPMGPPAAPAAAATSTVGPDSPVAQVRAVQRGLNAHGARLRVDGAWGPATTRAVRLLQERLGLPVDGRVGPQTAAVLRRRP